MTAINVLTTASGAVGHMASDSLFYDEDGKVLGLRTKVLALPHAMTVCGVRGRIEDCQMAQDVIGAFESYDEIIDAAPQSLSAGIEAVADFEMIDVIILGWSARRGRVSAAIACSENADGLRFSEANAIVAPMLSDTDLGSIVVGGKFQSPERDLVRVIEKQRQMIAAEPRDERGVKHVIGGLVILTTVTRDTITQRILHHWPNEIQARERD